MYAGYLGGRVVFCAEFDKVLLCLITDFCLIAEFMGIMYVASHIFLFFFPKRNSFNSRWTGSLVHPFSKYWDLWSLFSLILGRFSFPNKLKSQTSCFAAASVSEGVFVLLQHMNIRGSESGIRSQGWNRPPPPSMGLAFCPPLCHIIKDQFSKWTRAIEPTLRREF